MRIAVRFLLLAPLIVLSTARFAQADDPAKSPPPSPPVQLAKPGQFELKIQSGGFERVAQVHVPASYRIGSKPPLVLLLHGAGGAGAGVLKNTRLAAKADQEGFLVVAPDGLPALPRMPANFRTNPPLWNSGQLRARGPRAAVDDVAFIRQLLDDLRQKVPYDETRVYCAGHSNGAAMAFRLGAELSERFAAIGAVAGMTSLEDPRPKRPLPTMCIFGDKDPLMPIDGGEIELPWGNRKNPPIAEPLAIWANALGCETKPTILSDQGGLKKVEYASKSGGPTLSVIYIAGQGHHWPGGEHSTPDGRGGPDVNTLDATRVLWEFFQSQSGAPADPAN